MQLHPWLVPIWSLLPLCLSKAEGLVAHQGKVVRVNPNDAELRELSVVSGHLLQDLQELETIWRQHQTPQRETEPAACLDQCGYFCTYLGPPPLQKPQCGCLQCHPPEMKCKRKYEDGT